MKVWIISNMNIIEDLAQQFKQFPGIGPRQAKRFVYFLLKKDSAFRHELSHKINELGQNVSVCQDCHNYFIKRDATNSQKCGVCSNPNRDTETLMIVTSDTDLEIIEKSNIFHGKYFILGGNLGLSNNLNQNNRIDKLKLKIQKEKDNIKEIILALSATPEGEMTTNFLKKELRAITKPEIKISILGRGLSTGTEIEYSDAETIKNALSNRIS